MDDFKPKGKCPKCGQGGLEIIIPKKPTELPFRSTIPKDVNFCKTCGTSLRSICSSCKGTGKKSGLRFQINRDRFCSQCGRELPKDDDTCTNCGGTGQIINFAHYQKCPERGF